MGFDDATVERCAARMWNSTASIPWDQIPAEWKPFYRAWARACLEGQ